MAGRLKEFTGIDPYTIDQIILSERSVKDFESPHFKLVHSNRYSILQDKNGKAFNNHRVDALLYSPPTKYIYNRPDWIFENNKSAYFLNPKEISITFPIIAKAYMETDDLEKSIPIDIIEVKSEAEISKTAIALFNKGRFLIKLVDKSGKTQTFNVRNNGSKDK